MKKIKIICTIGPSSLDENIVKKMDDSGVDYFRINLLITLPYAYSQPCSKKLAFELSIRKVKKMFLDLEY